MKKLLLLPFFHSLLTKGKRKELQLSYHIIRIDGKRYILSNLMATALKVSSSTRT